VKRSGGDPVVSTIHHTWLFQPASWRAEGRFWERGEVERAARGNSVVRHAADVWEIEGDIEVLGEPLLRFDNRYVVTPPAAGARTIQWHSHNPAVGELSGVFALAGDTIMSWFRSADGRAVGSEHLTQLARDRYQARGVFLMAGEVASTWSMELVRRASDAV